MTKTPVQVLLFGADPVLYPPAIANARLTFPDTRLRWSEELLAKYESTIDTMIARYSDSTPLNEEYRLLNGYDTPPGTRQYGVDSICHKVREAGYTCQVVHYTHYMKESDVKQIFDKFVDSTTLLIGFSQTFAGGFGLGRDRHQLVESIYWPSSRQHLLKEWAKVHNPNVKFVLGGAQLNDAREIHKEDDPLKIDGTPLDDVDIFNHGFGDVTIVEMLQDIEQGSPKPDYIDKHSRLNIVENISRYEDEDLIYGTQQLGLEVGRGCIFKCKFCSFSLIGKEKGSYIKGYECIEAELVHNWQKYGVYKYFITDDTFNDDTEKLERILAVKKKYDIPLEIYAYIRIDLMHRLKQEQLLKDIGLKCAYIGVETLNPESSAVIGKGWDPNEQLAYIKELKSPDGVFGDDVRFHASFIYGLPEDTKETIGDMHNKLVDIDNNKIDQITIFPLMIVDTKLRDVTVNQSDITANWKDYGYRADNEEVSKIHKSNTTFKTLREDASSIEEEDDIPSTIWINKHGVRFLYCLKLANITKNKWIKNAYGWEYVDDFTRSYVEEVLNNQKIYLDKLLSINGHTRYN